MLDALKNAANTAKDAVGTATSTAKDAVESAATATSEAASEMTDNVQRALINKALDAVEKTGEEALKRESLDSVTVGAEFALGPFALKVDATFKQRS